MYCSTCLVNQATCAIAGGLSGTIYLCGKCRSGTLNQFLPTPPDARAAIERLQLERAWALPSPEHGR